MSEEDALYPHYQHLAIKPWEYIIANNLGFTEGCIIKYLSRYQYKDGLRDLLKAQVCLESLIERQRRTERYVDDALERHSIDNPGLPQVDRPTN